MRIAAESVSPHVGRFLDARFRHVARNSAWAIATTVVVAAAVFVETILLARHLGRHEFGVLVLVIAFPEAVQIVLDFRTREAMTRYLGGFLARGEHDRAAAAVKLLWLLDVAVLLVGLGIVLAAAPLVAPRLTGRDDAGSLMQIYAIAVVMGGLDNTAGSVLRVFDRFGLSFVVGAGAIATRLAIVASLIAVHASLRDLIWGRVAAECLGTAMIGGSALVLLKRALWSHRRARLATLASVRREIAGFLVHMNIQGSVRAAASKFDVLIVGALAGPGSASVYKIGVQFGTSPLLLSDPLFVAVYPSFTRWRALGHDRAARSVGRKSSLALAAIAVPAALALAIQSKSIVSLAVGRSFLSAWPLVVIILLSVLPALVLFWGRAAMLAQGDARTATLITTASVASQLLLLAVLVPPFHATGAAIALAAMNLEVALLTFGYLRRRGLI